MKKLSILAVLVMALCFCTSSYAADDAGHSWYVGIGGSWAMANFDDDELEDAWDEQAGIANANLGPAVDFDDGYGFNLRVGHHYTENLIFTFAFDYVAGFDSDESINKSFEGDCPPCGPVVADLDGDVEVDVMTFMLEGKYSWSGDVRPFVVVGVGVMNADADADLSGTVTVDDEPVFSPKDFDEDDTNACGKVGLGVDWFVRPDVSVGLEGSYVFGLSDFDFDDVEMAIEYFNIGLGVAYHF